MNEYRLVKKIKILEVIIFLLTGTLGVRLCYLQVISYEKIYENAQNMWQRNFPLAASRGYIYDCNNKEIALNLPSLSLYAIPYQIKDKEKCAKILSEILKCDYQEIYQKINVKKSSVKLSPWGRKISEETSYKIEKAKLKGILTVQDIIRYYPYDNLLAHSLGYVGIDNQGLGGLEYYYDEVVKGKNGNLKYLLDAKGGAINNYHAVLEAPMQGMSLKLTINLKLQMSLERELYNAYKMYSPNSCYGIMMNPNNGDILAICSYPSFNPNEYQNYDNGIYNQNLPIFKSYEPGSTFKVFSFALALEKGKIDMDKDLYYDKGYEYVEGTRIKSWKKGGHGLQTFLEVLQNSSNPGFVEIARRLGKENIYQGVLDFGFAKKTNVDLPGETSGLFFKYQDFKKLEQATTCFGQGISVSQIQMLRAFCSLINGGKLYKPKIVKEIKDSFTKETISVNEDKVEKITISENTSKLMQRALESVVALGSGGRAFIDGYRVGGKTGTAQVVNENGSYLDGKYILSFMGAIPINDPKVALIICLDRPANCVQYGGTIAAPIVKKVFMDTIKILDIPPQEGQIEKVKNYYDEETYVLPNYCGQKKNDVHSPYFNFIYEGNGEYIIDQLPKPGSKLPLNSKVLLLLGDK